RRHATTSRRDVERPGAIPASHVFTEPRDAAQPRGYPIGRQDHSGGPMARLMGVTGWRGAALASIWLGLAACVREGRSVIAAPCVVPQADLDAALAAHRRHTTELMAIPGVLATAVGATADCRPVIMV